MLIPVGALALSLVGLAVVAVDPRHRRGTVLPAVSVAVCVVGSLALVIAGAVRVSAVSTVTAALLLAAIPVVCFALARLLPAWSGPAVFPLWWWQVIYSGVIVGLGLFAVLLPGIPGPAGIGSMSDRIDPIVAASAAFLSILPQIACNRARLASGWGGAGALAGTCVAAVLMTRSGTSLDLAAAAGWLFAVSTLNIARPCAAAPQLDPHLGKDAKSAWRVAAISGAVAFGATMAVVVDWGIRRFI
jgi:hypothetical protein